jgi:cell wall assembly regulator SMI1
VGEIRDRLAAALSTIEQYAKGKFELRLRPPATEDQLLGVEAEFGHRLPEELRELYLLHDGQDQVLSTGYLFLGEPFATLSRALAAWRQFRDSYGVDLDRPTEGDAAWPSMDKELRPVEFDIRWFPFGITEESKAAYFVDLNPIEGRPVGQVIEEGPWAHPPQYIASSVLELLETAARHIGFGDMVVMTFSGLTSWGFGPLTAGFVSFNRYREMADGQYPSFVDDLPPEWSAYLRTKSPLFSHLFRAVAQGVDPSAVRDIPVPPAALARIDMAARPPSSPEELDDISKQRWIILRGATSLRALEGAPVRSLVIEDSPDVSFRGLEESAPELDLVGDVAVPDVDLPNIKAVTASIGRAASWKLLDRLPGLTACSLLLAPDTDPNDYDWSSSRELTGLTLRGGSVGSLLFVSQLPKLKFLNLLEPVAMKVAGFPDGRKVRLSIVNAPVPSDIADLARLDVPAELAGPIEWFRVLEGLSNPGVWTQVYEGGDTSTWTDLSALNWAERRRVMSERGLDKS